MEHGSLYNNISMPNFEKACYMYSVGNVDLFSLSASNFANNTMNAIMSQYILMSFTCDGEGELMILTIRYHSLEL